MKKYGVDEIITINLDCTREVGIRYMPYALNKDGQKVTFQYKENIIDFPTYESALDYAKTLYKVIYENNWDTKPMQVTESAYNGVY